MRGHKSPIRILSMLWVSTGFQLKQFLKHIRLGTNIVLVCRLLVNKTSAKQMKWIVSIIMKDMKMGLSSESVIAVRIFFVGYKSIAYIAAQNLGCVTAVQYLSGIHSNEQLCSIRCNQPDVSMCYGICCKYLGTGHVAFHLSTYLGT